MDSKHELETVNWGVIGIYNYKGTLIERLVGGYRVFGQTCNTPQEVDIIIQNACSSISESINRGGVTVDCSNGSNVAINSLGG